MGNRLFDQYTLLHFAVGIVCYFWGLSHNNLLIIHIVFELLENTPMGIVIINKIPFWPGGKPHADAVINMISDTVACQVGWLCAQALDHYSTWDRHLN